MSILECPKSRLSRCKRRAAVWVRFNTTKSPFTLLLSFKLIFSRLADKRGLFKLILTRPGGGEQGMGL